MSSKAQTLLGFAAKAGKLGFGMDAAVNSLKKHKSHLIVIADDVSKKSGKEITFFADNSKVMVITLDFNMETLSHAVGRRCGIITVNDKGFAEALAKLYN